MQNTQDSEALKWQMRFERERLARKEAEKLLESKSMELYLLNESLKQKVEQEVLKNRDKDLVLFQQSKMASMGEMIANIAHQWRQPLSAISSIASSHLLHYELQNLNVEECKHSYDEILKHTLFLSQTIEDFRNFFRQDKQKVIFQLESSITQCLDILKGLLKNHSITVNLSIQDCRIENLQGEFLQVLLNLLKNSIDALTVSQKQLKLININSVVIDNKKFILTISDNAGGIPEAIIDKIFDPYFTTKHKSQGTGLGLFMSAEIIQKHMNGILKVTNLDYNYNETCYRGACFTIELEI